MTHFIFTCIFVVLMVKIIRCQNCNQFYQIIQGNNYANIRVPTPEDHNNNIKLSVQVEYANEEFSVETGKWKLQYLGNIEDIEEKRPLIYKLTYDVTYYIVPKITSISINNNKICVSESITGFSGITSLNLHLSIQINTFNKYGNNLNQNGNRLVTTKRPLPILYAQPSSTASPYFQIATNGNLNNNRISHNNNRKTSSSLLNTCGKTSKTPGIQLIANGDNAEMNAYPWIGAMFLRQKEKSNQPRFLCGSSLITKKHAITAGHCVKENRNNPEMFVIFGRTLVNDWLDVNSQLVKVVKSDVHPEYKMYNADADIAILHFNKEITFTVSVQPVCLWDTNDLAEDIVDNSGLVAGWGKNEKYQFPQHLQEIYLRAVSEEECLRAADKFVMITSNRTICAGNNDNSGPCEGDSGSGFYFFLNDRWFIRGIVSQALKDSTSRCDFSKYVVFVDIAKHLQWIHENL